MNDTDDDDDDEYDDDDKDDTRKPKEEWRGTSLAFLGLGITVGE